MAKTLPQLVTPRQNQPAQGFPTAATHIIRTVLQLRTGGAAQLRQLRVNAAQQLEDSTNGLGLDLRITTTNEQLPKQMQAKDPDF